MIMYTALKKTKEINKYKLQSIPKPRDLYARYGRRVNPQAIHSSDGHTVATPSVESPAVIATMTAGQSALKRATAPKDDLPK